MTTKIEYSEYVTTRLFYIIPNSFINIPTIITAMTLDQITVNMDIIIRDEISEILSTKPEDQRYLNYLDMRQVCSTIKRYCCDSIGEIPQEVEMACCFAEAVLAPDKKEKKKLIKQAASLASGTGGVTCIVLGIGAALGWGSGVLAAMTVFFAGTSVTIPVIAITGGLALSVIAGYFMFHDDAPTLSNKAIKALSKGVEQGLSVYWERRSINLTK